MRLGAMPFAHRASGFGAAPIEVAQADRPQAAGPADIGQHRLRRQLAASMWAERPHWRALGDRQLLDLAAIDRTTAGKHHEVDTGLEQCVEQRQTPSDVVPVIPGRIGHRFGDIGESGEVAGTPLVALRERSAEGVPIMEATNGEPNRSKSRWPSRQIVKCNRAPLGYNDGTPGFGRHR